MISFFLKPKCSNPSNSTEKQILQGVTNKDLLVSMHLSDMYDRLDMENLYTV